MGAPGVPESSVPDSLETEAPVRRVIDHAGETTVSVQNLSITYRTVVDRSNTIRQRMMRIGRGGGPNVREVQAVKDVSFDVKHGTVIGHRRQPTAPASRR